MNPDERLIQLFQSSLQGLLDEAVLVEDFTDNEQALSFLESVYEALDVLELEVNDVIPFILQEAYQTGMAAAESDIGKMQRVRPFRPIIHAEALEALVDDSLTDLNAAIRTAKESAVTNVRETLNNVDQQIGRGIISGDNRLKVTQQVARTFSESGLTAITTIDGRKLPIDVYAETVVRTRTRKANTSGAINRYRDNGVGLVTTSAHSPTCDHCARLQGQVISLTGAHPGYLSINEEGVSLPPWHPNCYGKDTEIFSERGWINIKDAKEGEAFLSLDPDTLDMEWVKAKATVKAYADKVIHFHNKDFDMVVSKNHQMLYQTDWDSKHNKKRWRFTDAQNLLHKKSGSFYRSSEWSGKDIDYVEVGKHQVPLPLYASLLGWYLSDGSADNTYKRISIAQHRTKSTETRKEIEELIKAIGWRFGSSEETITINEGIYEHFCQFGKAAHKFVPKVIKEASPETIRLFLDSFVKADGHTRPCEFFGYKAKDEKMYFTTSVRLAADLGELLIKAGSRPSYTVDETAGKEHVFNNGTYTINNNLIRIRECHRQRSTMQAMRTDVVSYNDYVYCVELEKFHTVLVRSKGKVAWSGNCRHVVQPFVEEYETEEDIQRAKDKAKAFKPDADPRTPSQKKAYADEQNRHRITRNEQKQYNRWKALLGDEAPTTVGAFRRMKRQNTVKFQELQSEYRSLAQQVNTFETLS